MMNLSSVMGSEPLCTAYPFHRYKHTAFYKRHSGCLAEYIQMYSLWFRPWYLLARLRGAASGGVLRGGVRWRLCELGTSPSQQPVGSQGVTWALPRVCL